MTTKAFDHLARMDEVLTCYDAIGDLMSPEGDLQERQRDNIAVLMDFLRREYEQAREQLTLS